MADIKKQFNNMLVDLIQLLKDNNKDYKKMLNNYYKNYLVYFNGSDEQFEEYISKFNNNIFKYHEDIMKCDEMIFSNDMGTDPIYILENIDFKLLWKSLSIEDRDKVWKKLKILYTLSIHILKCSSQFKALYQKQRQIMQEIVDGLNQKHKIEMDIKMKDAEEELENKINFEDIRKMFGDNVFTDLIIEVVKELGIDSSNNSEMIFTLIRDAMNLKSGSQNPDDIFNTSIGKIINKIRTKMESKNITVEQLVGQLDSVREKFGTLFKDFPAINNLLDTLSKRCQDMFDNKDIERTENGINENGINGTGNMDINDETLSDKIKDDINNIFKGEFGGINLEENMRMLKEITSEMESMSYLTKK